MLSPKKEPFYKIINATKQDSTGLALLDQSCFPDQPMTATYFYEAIDFAAFKIFVAKNKNSNLIGYASIFIHQKKLATIQLGGVCVAPMEQRKAVASKLIYACIYASQNSGYKKMELFVAPKNKPAINLYNKFGFQVIAEVPNYYGCNTPRLNMRLLLDRNLD